MILYQSLEKANDILNDSESSDEEDIIDTSDYVVPSNVRKIKVNNCQCDICKRVRECLEEYESYETLQDQRF